MKCQKHWTVSLSVEAFYHPVSSTNYGKPLFSSPRLSLAKWEKTRTAVRWCMPLKPCFNFYGSKCQKTKVQFVFEIPLSVALSCRTQPVVSASPSWIIAFFRTGGQLRHKEKWQGGEPEGWGLMKVMRVGLWSLSGQPGFPSLWPGCSEGTLLREEEWAHPRLHPLLPRPFCYHRSPEWLCLSQQPTFHGRARGRKDPVERNGEGRARDHLAQGILSASSLILWIVHPSAHCEDGEAECPKAVQ